MAKVKTQNVFSDEEMIGNGVNSVEKFFNDHKKCIWGTVIAVLVIGLGVLAYSKFVYGPQSAEAQSAAVKAEMYFQAGQFDLALNGDGVSDGFEAIAEQYGTKAGKAIYLYAGSCCAQLGDYEKALEYLAKYNGKDDILAARAIALKADCYVCLGDIEKAVVLYGKAASKADNIFAASYLVKQGRAYENLGQVENAKACYQKVKDFYPMSIEAYDIDKLIAR